MAKTKSDVNGTVVSVGSTAPAEDLPVVGPLIGRYQMARDKYVVVAVWVQGERVVKREVVNDNDEPCGRYDSDDLIRKAVVERIIWPGTERE